MALTKNKGGRPPKPAAPDVDVAGLGPRRVLELPAGSARIPPSIRMRSAIALMQAEAGERGNGAVKEFVW